MVNEDLDSISNIVPPDRASERRLRALDAAADCDSSAD
jgi:hypothetical protein